MCEFYTNLGDAAITGNTTLKARFAQLVNSRYHTVVTKILKSQDDWDFDDSNHADFPIMTTPLVASQRDYGIPVSEKVLKIKRVDITYDGTNWNRVLPLDSSEIEDGLGNDANIDANFDKSMPRYDLQYNSIWVYPLATSSEVAAGAQMRLEWTREIDEFVVGDTTQEPGIDEPFHILLPIGASLDWAIAKRLPLKSDLKVLWDEKIKELEEYYHHKDIDRKYHFRFRLKNMN